MTICARSVVALVALSSALTGAVAHAQDASEQGPEKEKPGAAGPETKQTAPSIRMRAKASPDGKAGQVCVIVAQGDSVVLTMDSIEVLPRKAFSSTTNRSDVCPKWDYRVSLVPGVQYLEASVYRNGSDKASAFMRDSLIGRADSTAMASTLHILTVGINTYPAGIDSLSFAVADARAFKDFLERQSAPLFGRIRVDSLYDRDATKEAIIGQLLDIRDRVKPNDTFVFFFAGHGAMENGHMFLAAAEVNSLASERTLTFKGIRDDDLLNLIADIKGSTLVVLDACHSGQIITAFQNKETRAEAASRFQYESRPNMAILAATDSGGLAEENGELRQGLFTAALLRGRSRGQPRGIRKTADLNAEAKKFLAAWYLEKEPPQNRDETHIWKEPSRDFNLVVR